jgi:large subunit ribosomal protein L15
MQFHNLKRNKANRKAKQVGRGGTRGKTSGRGTKGQNARSGRKKRPEMRDIIKRLPKLRGRGKNVFKSRFEKPIAINISRVKMHFKEGEEINAKTLLEKGIIKTRNGRLQKVKILNG